MDSTTVDPTTRVATARGTTTIEVGNGEPRTGFIVRFVPAGWGPTRDDCPRDGVGFDAVAGTVVDVVVVDVVVTTVVVVELVVVVGSSSEPPPPSPPSPEPPPPSSPPPPPPSPEPPPGDSIGAASRGAIPSREYARRFTDPEPTSARTPLVAEAVSHSRSPSGRRRLQMPGRRFQTSERA